MTMNAIIQLHSILPTIVLLSLPRYTGSDTISIKSFTVESSYDVSLSCIIPWRVFIIHFPRIKQCCPDTVMGKAGGELLGL